MTEELKDACGAVTRDEAIHMVKEYARSVKYERNDQTGMRFWHIVNLLSGGYAQAPSAGKVAAVPVAERTERPFNQGPGFERESYDEFVRRAERTRQKFTYGAFTPTSEGTEKAREFLIGYMRSGMGSGIYDNFIRYELAGDFAWNLANGLNALTAEKVADDARDAARYRWLRQNCFDWAAPGEGDSFDHIELHFEHELLGRDDSTVDEAIDAEIAHNHLTAGAKS